MLGWFSRHIFLGAAQRRLIRRRTPVFTWHKIGPAPQGSADPFLYVAPAEFERQLRSLTALGRSAITLNALAQELRGPESGREPGVILTFDDGFCDVLRNGLPILQRNGGRSIQFLVSGFLGKTNDWDIQKGEVPGRLMNVSEVREWLAAGQEIGSHSVSHPNLKKLGEAEAFEEIVGSKKALEDTFGVPIRHFCYPFGGYNQKVRDLVAQAGYETACTVDFGVNLPGCDPFALRRIIPLSAMAILKKILHRVPRKLGLVGRQ